MKLDSKAFSLKIALMVFLFCWLVFLVTGTAIGSLFLFLKWHHLTFLSELSSILSISICYFVIWRVVIFKEVELFSSSDFTEIKENLWIPVLILALSLQIISQSFVDVYNHLFFPEYEHLMNNYHPKFNLGFLISAGSAVLISPVCEEYLFRKYFFGKLLTKYSFGISMLVSSLFFSMMHLPLMGKLLPTFLLGCTSAFVYYKTGKLGYSILLHMLSNLMALFTDIYIPDFWDFLHQLHFNDQYWILIFLGVSVYLVAIIRLSKNTLKNSENNSKKKDSQNNGNPQF